MKLSDSIEKYRLGKTDKYEVAEQIHKNSEILQDICQCFKRSDSICSLSANGIAASINVQDIGKLNFNIDPVDYFSIATWAMLLGTAYVETEVLSLFKKFVSSGCTVFDIGANIGWYSIISARLGASVYAFEPISHTFESLKNNIRLNNFSAEIYAYNMGCTDENGEDIYYFDERASGSASRKDLNYLQDGQSQKVLAKQTRLDDFVTGHSTQRIDLIKCDVEGGELFVFKGAGMVLNKFRPLVICEMLRKHAAKFGYYPDETIALFESYGYICVALDKNKPCSGYVITHMTNETEETNYLFVPKERLVEVSELVDIYGIDDEA